MQKRIQMNTYIYWEMLRTKLKKNNIFIKCQRFKKNLFRRTNFFQSERPDKKWRAANWFVLLFSVANIRGILYAPTFPPLLCAWMKTKGSSAWYIPQNSFARTKPRIRLYEIVAYYWAYVSFSLRCILCNKCHKGILMINSIKPP